MYSRELEGRTLTIGVSGMLRKNALVMYDRETETLWAHFTGESLAGPLMGKTLKMVASTPRVRFGDWKKAHPGTLVLTVDGVSDRPTSYPGYATDQSRLGIRPVENLDDRLPPKQVVLGLRTEGGASAVPVSLLQKKGVVALEIGEQEIVAFGNPDTGLFGAFVVPAGLRFARVERRRLVAEDGREWSAVTGEGHVQLEPVAAVRSFWFAWADHYPESGLVSVD